VTRGALSRGARAAITWTAACGALSCSRCDDAAARAGADASTSDGSAREGAALSALPSGSTSAAPPERDASLAVTDAATSVAEGAAPDGGPSACRLVYGPAEQAFRGPAAMVTSATELKLVANDSGKPRIFAVKLGPPPPASAPAVVPPKPSSFFAMRWPPCEMAGRWAYCQAAGGIVYRTTLGATDTKQIAKSQPSTRIAAAALGPDHAVLGTLDARRTTEGVLMQAFVTLDDGETTRLSEDGAGATVLQLVPRGDRAVALYLDARMAMLPVHARPMSLRGRDLALADDTVVFVGGPPERGIELTPAVAGSSVFALVPTARETTDFGMAAIPIAESPKDDVQPTWSLYPNGLDPAPIAATSSAVAGERRDGGTGGVGAATSAWVARVRPSERTVGAPRIVELGRLDSAGAFTSLGGISTGKRVTDMAITADAYGSVWILYGDTNATWLERRVCP
jgi:hypothetical protein